MSCFFSQHVKRETEKKFRTSSVTRQKIHNSDLNSSTSISSPLQISSIPIDSVDSTNQSHWICNTQDSFLHQEFIKHSQFKRPPSSGHPCQIRKKRRYQFRFARYGSHKIPHQILRVFDVVHKQREQASRSNKLKRSAVVHGLFITRSGGGGISDFPDIISHKIQRHRWENGVFQGARRRKKRGARPNRPSMLKGLRNMQNARQADQYICTTRFIFGVSLV